MPPRLSLFTSRSVAFRTKPSIPQKRFAPAPAVFQQCRSVGDDANKKTSGATQGPIEPNADQLPHVSEEQAALDKSTGGTPPDIEQGTPVQEVLERDKDAQDKAPEVLKEKLNKPGSSQVPAGARPFSTSTSRQQDRESQSVEPSSERLLNHPLLVPQPKSGPLDTRLRSLEYPGAGLGHKFPLPALGKFTDRDNFKTRYDPMVQQFTRSIMRDGKLSRAQKNMELIMNTLRTSPPPSGVTPAQTNAYSGSFQAPIPREALALSPVAYLTAIIDSVSPLVKIRQAKGVLGGGANMPIPAPLTQRQRRRTAIKWILDAADKRREPKLADRVAKELINIAEGRGGAWEKRHMVHRLAVNARANLKTASGISNFKKRGQF